MKLKRAPSVHNKIGRLDAASFITAADRHASLARATIEFAIPSSARPFAVRRENWDRKLLQSATNIGGAQGPPQTALDFSAPNADRFD
jgi:hypothetical protein